jgi:hypothetical protein
MRKRFFSIIVCVVMLFTREYPKVCVNLQTDVR